MAVPINYNLFLRKTPIVTDEDYTGICPDASSIPVPKPCVVTREKLQSIGVPVFYKTIVDSDTDEVQTVVKIGVKRFLGACPSLKYRIGMHSSQWEPWNGTNDNLCIDHIWRVGMLDPNAYRHDWAYCDGSFTLDPPEYDPSYPPTPSHPLVRVTDLYWLDLSDGSLKSSFWREEAGSYPIGHVHYRTSYLEWQAHLDTVNGTTHEGKRNLQIKIDTEFIGLQEGDYLPNKSAIFITLTDVNSNFVRLYFKADPAYLDSIGQSGFLVGDGLVNIAFADWGLNSDLAKIQLFTYSDFADTVRKVNYQCDFISLLP